MNYKEYFKKQLVESITINDYYPQPPAVPPVGDPIVPLTPNLSTPSGPRPTDTVGRPTRPSRPAKPTVPTNTPPARETRPNQLYPRPSIQDPGGDNPPGGGNPGGGNPGFKVPGSDPIDLRVRGRHYRKVDGRVNRGMQDGRARP